MTINLLLIQARAPDDPLTVHEQDCVRRRLDGLDVSLVVQNALSAQPETGWLRGVDAVVIGGSGNFSVNHALSQRWVAPLRAMLDVLLRRSTPTFGICFGHQLLGLHLGARVETHPDLEEVGTIGLELTSTGGDVAPFASLPHRFFAHTGHSDHVVDLPAGVTLVVRGDHVEMQGFRVNGAPVYTTQFHPDLTGAEARDRFLTVKGPGGGQPPGEELLRKAEAFRREGHDDAAGILARFVASLEPEISPALRE